MTTVGIVDYDMGNLDSVQRAVERCGGQPLVSGDPDQLSNADRIILPGVGSFHQGMDNLRRRGLDAGLDRLVRDEGRPFLGVCLGMQLMASRGSEGRNEAGLGWIDASCMRLEPTGPDTRVPHVGWNEVHLHHSSPLFESVRPGADFYFVHSYHVVPDDPALAIASTPYAGGFTSALTHRNMHGVQFHPEKSQKVGFQILRNFIGL